MLKKSLNTELDQIFSGVAPAGQAEIIRPQRRRRGLKMATVLILLVILFSGLWYYQWRASSLADYLPTDAEFYVALELPVPDSWYRPLLFWRSGPKVNSPAARLYQKLDLRPELWPLFSGRLELARPPGGGLVFKAQLADKAGWLKLAGADNVSLGFKTQANEMTPAGWWTALAAPDSKIYWLTDGDDLYLADRADLAVLLTSRPAQPLSRRLGSSLIKRDLLTVYISNLSFLNNLAPAYAAPLQAALAGPLIIKAQNHGQKLVWSTKGITKALAQAPTVGPDYDLTIFARDFSQVYSGWKNVLAQSLGFKTQANILPANIAQLEQIAKEFYQLDIQSLGAKLGTRENIFYLNGAGWLFLAKGGEEPAGEEIKQGLESFAGSLFAITHPKAVERTLSDGSIMTELRAETDGLEWRPYAWTAGGREYGLDYLQGQGEPWGFYTGFIPELGYVLTNQAEWLQSLPVLTAVDNSADLAVRLSPRLLTNDPFILDIIKRIGVGATAAGELSGYLEFWH